MIELILFTVVAALDADPKGPYPRADLLIEPAELAKPEVAKQYRVVDVRSPKDYDAGHIPGAVWVDPASWSKAFEAGQGPKDWAERIGKLGIADADARAVVYDDAKSKDAARIWWILRYWGVKDARLLNGGWQGWTSGKYPTAKERPEIVAGRYRLPQIQDKRLATKDFVLGQLKSKEYQIVDARSEGEHCGDTKLAKRGRAIPGAMHLEWSDALDVETHRFKSPADLSKILKDAGIALDRPTVTYCQSGGRAAVMAFTLELMGAREVRNYYRSWAEWGNDDDAPVVKGKRK